jgi:hypothetical protein
MKYVRILQFVASTRILKYILTPAYRIHRVHCP